MAKTIFITGCSDNGLGAALAIEFKKAGHRVIASARNLNKLNEVKAAGCEIVKLDVTSLDSVNKCAVEISSRLSGKLDILINNAGGMCSLPISDLDLEDVRKTFELNTFSIITMVQAFLPLLRAGQGWIVNQTSCAAVFALPMQGAYNASKAAASSLTQSLRLEMEPFGIKVIELRTGAVKTKFFDNGGADAVRLPAGSIYEPSREYLESKMAGEDLMKDAEPASIWAKNVVADLSRRSPPIFIYRGATAGTTRVGSIMPSWLFDGMMLRTMGLDVFKKRLAGQ